MEMPFKWLLPLSLWVLKWSFLLLLTLATVNAGVSYVSRDRAATFGTIHASTRTLNDFPEDQYSGFVRLMGKLVAFIADVLSRGEWLSVILTCFCVAFPLSGCLVIWSYLAPKMHKDVLIYIKMEDFFDKTDERPDSHARAKMLHDLRAAALFHHYQFDYWFCSYVFHLHRLWFPTAKPLSFLANKASRDARDVIASMEELSQLNIQRIISFSNTEDQLRKNADLYLQKIQDVNKKRYADTQGKEFSAPGTLHVAVGLMLEYREARQHWGFGSGSSN
jgi:hypothetical protein